MNKEELQEEARAWLKDNITELAPAGLEQKVSSLALFADEVARDAESSATKRIADELDDLLTAKLLFGGLEKRLDAYIYKLRKAGSGR